MGDFGVFYGNTTGTHSYIRGIPKNDPNVGMKYHSPALQNRIFLKSTNPNSNSVQTDRSQGRPMAVKQPGFSENVPNHVYLSDGDDPITQQFLGGSLYASPVGCMHE